jgi:hypothetical protein
VLQTISIIQILYVPHAMTGNHGHIKTPAHNTLQSWQGLPFDLNNLGPKLPCLSTIIAAGPEAQAEDWTLCATGISLACQAKPMIAEAHARQSP